MTSKKCIEILTSLKDRFEDTFVDEWCDKDASEAAESNHEVAEALEYAIERLKKGKER